MRALSKDIGLIGSIWAFGWSMLGLVVLRSAPSFPFYIIFFCLAIVGIIGGALALKRSVISIIPMLLSSSGLIVFLVKASGFGYEEGWDYIPAIIGYFVGTPIMIIGAILGIISALRSRNKRENTTTTTSYSPLDVKWKLSGALMPVPPYGSRDIPSSDTASALKVDQTVAGIGIQGFMHGLRQDTSYTVYLAKALTPNTFDLGLFRTTVPPLPFTTNSSGAADWYISLVNADFPNSGTYTLSVIINETVPDKSILTSDTLLTSDTFDVTIK